MDKKESWLARGWWNGLGVIFSIATFCMVYYQTERINSETEQLNKQLNIQRTKDKIEEYLNREWFDKAIEENKKLKSLDDKDSTCYYYFLYKYEQIPDKNSYEAEIASRYLNQSK